MSFTRRPEARDLPQPRAVEQADHDRRGTLHVREQPAHLRLAQYRRQAHRALRPHHLVKPRELVRKHMLVKKEQRGERLVLRRRGHVALYREQRL
jgi:hypothetical protein